MRLARLFHFFASKNLLELSATPFTVLFIASAISTVSLAADQTLAVPVAAAQTPSSVPALPDVSKFQLSWPDPSKPKRSARGTTKNKKNVVKKTAPEPAEKVEDAAALNSRAYEELTVLEKNRAMGIGISTGTVSLSVDQIESPFKNPAFQLGIALQAYQPLGRNQIEGLDSYDSSSLGSQPMGALEFRYMPFQAAGIAGSDLGFIASIGYTQHTLDLRTPTGIAVEGARLQTIVTEIEFANRYQLHRAPRWNFLQAAGLGRLDSIQSATSTLANSSSDLTFLAATLQAEYQIVSRWSAIGGYELREKISSSSDLGIQHHNFMLGFLGSFK